MGITHHEHGSLHVLAVSGNLDDTEIAMALVEAARPLASSPLAIDLSACPYVSSVGLAALVHVAAGHGSLPVVGPSAGFEFDRLLSITGIGELFTVCASRDEAVAQASG